MRSIYSFIHDAGFINTIVNNLAAVAYPFPPKMNELDVVVESIDGFNFDLSDDDEFTRGSEYSVMDNLKCFHT